MFILLVQHLCLCSTKRYQIAHKVFHSSCCALLQTATDLIEMPYFSLLFDFEQARGCFNEAIWLCQHIPRGALWGVKEDISILEKKDKSL